MVGTGEDHAAHTVLARGLVQVVHAHDVGLQDGRPGLLGGHTTQVHHRVHPGHHGLHGSSVGQVGREIFFPCLGFTQRHHIGQAQHLAIGLESTAQCLTQAASSAGEQQTVM